MGNLKTKQSLKKTSLTNHKHWAIVSSHVVICFERFGIKTRQWMIYYILYVHMNGTLAEEPYLKLFDLQSTALRKRFSRVSSSRTCTAIILDYSINLSYCQPITLLIWAPDDTVFLEPTIIDCHWHTKRNFQRFNFFNQQHQALSSILPANTNSELTKFCPLFFEK